MQIKDVLKTQLEFFNSNQSKPVDFRIVQLKKLKWLLKANEAMLYKAIYTDFGKSEFETYASEMSLVYHEINKFIKNLKKWSKPKHVPSGLAQFPAKSYIIPEPLGNVLVIGAWNYPYQLSLVPAISAIAAGNTVVLKPSELPLNTSKALAEIINQNFDSSFFYVYQGGVKETTELLKNRFDKIFFTGSIPVGRIVYEAAAKQLTPVTLELGGKSPAFVLPNCNLKMTAKRMVWAKFLNAGQTCVAPDYVLVHQSIEKDFLKALKSEIELQHKNGTELRKNYLQIINAANFDRLEKLIDKSKIYHGGQTNRETRIIAPTVLHQISFDDEIMEDEIFGPLLPVISFNDLDQAIKEVKARPKPLSCYVYTKNKAYISKILNEVSFGGGAINDSVMQLSNSNLPFGGVGFSGFGSYHGKAGFESFSHYKSILHQSFWLELNIKYAPYTSFKKKLVAFFME